MSKSSKRKKRRVRAVAEQADFSASERFKLAIERIDLKKKRWKYGAVIIGSLATVVIVLILAYCPENRANLISNFLARYNLIEMLVFIILLIFSIIGINWGGAKILSLNTHDDIEA